MKHTKKTITAFGIASLVILTLVIAVACGPDAPKTTFTPEEPVGGASAIYAPDSWPLEIGDTIMSKEWGDLRSQFPSVLHLGDGLRVVDGVAYEAHMRSVDVVEPGADPLTALIGYVYQGHVPITFFWIHDDQVLPPEIEGVREIYTTEDAINRGLRPRVYRKTLPDTVPVGRIVGSVDPLGGRLSRRTSPTYRQLAHPSVF